MHIRLCMIVKDEAQALRLSLPKLKPLISSWCIVDTGSTDDTQAVVLTELEGLPGQIHSRPWVNHAHNRTEAFGLARTTHEAPCDYIFWTDAKDMLVQAPERVPANHLGFNILVRYGNLEFDRPALLNPDPRWAWSQGVHEALTFAGVHIELQRLAGFVVAPQPGVQASAADPQKFAKQVEILRAELAASPSNTRAAYYLAQALRDDGQLQAAHDQYLARVAMGGWVEETWSALLEAAKLKERLGKPASEVVFAYLSAYQARPTRAESLTHLARYVRCLGQHEVARIFATFASEIPRPADRLFIEFGAYGWLAAEELALANHFTGRDALAVDAIDRIDVESITVPSEKARILNNRHLMRAKIGK